MPRRPKMRWHQRDWVSTILAWLAAFYIRLIHRTCSWQVHCTPAVEALIREGRPFIGAFWHGRLLMSYPAWQTLLTRLGTRHPSDLYVIASTHADGRLIQRAAHFLGAKAVLGSSRRGGVKALREARTILGHGHILVITPDGPKGPRMRSHPGVAFLAKSTRVPVVPITFATQRQCTLNSWDRFMLVLPFARGHIAFGEPIDLLRDGDTEAQRALIEQRMIDLSTETDRLSGIEPILPAA